MDYQLMNLLILTLNNTLLIFLSQFLSEALSDLLHACRYQAYTSNIVVDQKGKCLNETFCLYPSYDPDKVYSLIYCHLHPAGDNKAML